jgi:hypothetical protein
MKKEKKTKNQKKTIKSEKKRKKKKHAKKTPTRRVNGPAQRHAHAGGAEFRSANRRSIGFPHILYATRCGPKEGQRTILP